jgi:hypothetical protein
MAIEQARRSNTQFDPVGDLLSFNLVLAHWTITAGKEPAWFREHFGEGQDIQESYGLPSDILLALALALDLSLSSTPIAAVTDIRQKLAATQRRLKKARAGMLQLRELVPMTFPPLRPEYLKVCEFADGSVEYEGEPDPTDVAVEAVDEYLKRLSEIKIPIRKGRWPSLLRYAVRRFQQIVERENPSLSHEQLVALCELLFDPVQKRHGRQSRSPVREQDDTPGYSHLLG